MNLKKRKALLSLWGLMLLLLWITWLIEFDWVTKGIKGIDFSLVQSVLILVALALCLIQLRRQDLRLKNISRTADQIGRGEWKVRSDRVGRDSIGQLAQRINVMADNIENAIENLDKVCLEQEKTARELEMQNDRMHSLLAGEEHFARFQKQIASIEVEELARIGLRALTELTHADCGYFYIMDAATGSWSCMGKRGERPSWDALLSHPHVITFLVPRIAQNPSHSLMNLEDFSEVIGFFEPEFLPCGSFMGVPITFGGRVLGVIILCGQPKCDDSRRVKLEYYAESFGNALSNALTFKAVQRQSIELEIANRRLLELDRQKSEFVASMSHELRTPLNSIIGFSGILQKNRDNNLTSKDLDRVDTINRNGRHLLDLINNILDLSKIEAGKLTFEHEPIEVEILVRDVAEMLLPQAETKGILLTHLIEEGLPLLYCDSIRLKQVLINLVGNGLKFTHEGYVGINVSLDRKDEHFMVFDIIDTGIGIAEDQIEQIFDAFHQADSSTSRKYGGSGLGLTISKSIIECLGGKFEVSSRVNSGSKFRIRLPVKPDDWEASSEVPQVEMDDYRWNEESDGKTLKNPVFRNIKKLLNLQPGKRVLVVDDDPFALKLLAEYLKEMKAEVIASSSPMHVLELAQREMPDLITLDIRMPEKDGWAVLKELKSSVTTRDIPAIMISIVAEENKALKLGAHGVLAKPVSRAEFRSMVQECLNPDHWSGRKFVVVGKGNMFGKIKHGIPAGLEGTSIIHDYEADFKRILAQESPDLIVVECDKPFMNAFRLLRQLKDLPECVDIPLVVVASDDLSAEERILLDTHAEMVVINGLGVHA